jgi:hypothetical protein
LFQGTIGRPKPRLLCYMRGPIVTVMVLAWLPDSQATLLHKLFSCPLAVLSSCLISSLSLGENQSLFWYRLSFFGHFM